MRHWLTLLLLIVLKFSAEAQNPRIFVIDTDFSKGRLTNRQTISLNDVTKLHGHLCDGLAVGFIGLREALYRLYPDSTIDRTNTRIVSKSSPCLTDIALYLTGGRYQFNSFYVSDSIPYMFIVQRIDNGKSMAVKLKPGIKPPAIDSLGSLANSGKLDACSIDSLQRLENKFLAQILATNPTSSFSVDEIKIFN
ncbi:formylmethanofuran dehydrogenase subunit E family protein [Flavihumibacter stibioxidans]|uniref:Formylmethanofuran dehydrogenase subunit E domain-containing protein n=1 Tax=Flavihumibacter stibioxidans TaxID=1834163 RepID=A0ABR7M8F4_9BACT|nr:formylmethanofuran dehydrogenase subunit E family protein [Flavihumibacter stibioxidans]MBC6491310.1 hypothetical protein [Flavihumibacter stibioxidans]